MTAASPSIAPRRLTGRCLCGAITYQVDDAFEYAMNCHCSQCRRATGSAFKSFAGIRSTRLAIADDAAATLIYGDPLAAHDVHCGRCGSLLFSIVRGGTYAHVTMGTLVGTPGIKPSMHIFVSSKAPWHDITDDLPQHAGFPGD